MKHLVLVIALAAFSTSAFAEGTSSQNAEELRLVRSISVYIEDHVKDGCLSKPNALKVEAELTLRRSGISVTDFDPNYQLGIAPFGWDTVGQSSGSCSVTVRLELWRFAKVTEGHLALVIACFCIAGH